MSEKNKNVLTPLGRKSAEKYNKQTFISKNSTQIGDYAILDACVGYVRLEVNSWLESGDGDHRLALCRVVESVTLRDLEVLTWNM